MPVPSSTPSLPLLCLCPHPQLFHANDHLIHASTHFFISSLSHPTSVPIIQSSSTCSPSHLSWICEVGCYQFLFLFIRVIFEIGLTGTGSILSWEVYCIVIALGGYGWY